MSNNNSSSSNRSEGISFVGLLAVAFIALGLTGYVGWPWLWLAAMVVVIALGFLVDWRNK